MVKCTESLAEEAYSGRLYTVEEVMHIVLQDKPFYAENSVGNVMDIKQAFQWCK